jgi:hypothetical protein
VPLYDPKPKLNEYTNDDLLRIQQHFGDGLLGITQEHETWIDPVWTLAAAAVDNQEEVTPDEEPPDDPRHEVFMRTLDALDVLTYGRRQH